MSELQLERDVKQRDPVSCSKTGKQMENKDTILLSLFKNNKTTFLLPWCLSHSVSIFCRNDPEVLRNTYFLIVWLKNAA